MKKTLILSILFLMLTITARGGGIGTWKSYLAYGDISEIQSTGKIIYVLSSKGLFSYNTADQSVQTYDKMNALSDCNISHIAYCKAAKRLVIVYQNQNIDLLEEDGNVVNISAYYNKSMTADKTINEVKIIGKYAFLSTSFGILKINVADAEITDTYNLGLKILSTVTHGDYIFAAVENNGIISAKTTNNLLDKGNWTQFSSQNLKSLYDLNGQLIGISDDAVYHCKTTEWEKIYDYPTIHSTLADDKLMLIRPDVVWVIDANLQRTVIPHTDNQLKAIIYDKGNNCYWSNQSDDKLYSFTLDGETIIPSLTNINPDGPKYNYFGFLKYVDNTLYSCGGGFNSSELFRPAIIQTMKNDEWTLFQGDTEADYLFQDFVCLDLDPQNPTHIFAGGRTGLYEYNNEQMVKYYNTDNSLLNYSTADCTKNYILTLGAKFDKQGNLWCLNSLAESASILKLSTDGTWESHHTKLLMDDNSRSLANLRCLIMDSRGYLWFVNNHWALPSFYCFDPSSDAINYYTSFINEDGTNITTTGVRCIEEDKNGNMWIGTNVGPLMLPAEDLSQGSNCVLQQVKVPRNDGTNFADYLLSGVDITCIAVDGGGRKWFGTNGNGVYLISEDNMQQVQHFTSTNSMLLSNNIEAITINDNTGEVFFGTDYGLCSYMSDASATNENMTKDNVYAYPNPVEPDYTGMITIVGLSYNADVKIVTANGALVAAGTSNGGSFTWNGCDLNGKRVASGVYMVETATSEGKKGTVCKIAVVR